MTSLLWIAVLLLITPLIAHESTNGLLSPPFTCTTTTTLCQPGGNVEHPVATSPNIRQGRDGKRGARGKKGQKGETELVVNFPENCEEYKSIQMRLGKEPNKENVTTFPLKSMVIQRRMDGSVDFYRGWTSYANGFGNNAGEFWIGLNFLHKLTTSRDFKLRIELRNWEGESSYAEYSTFRVGDEASKFPLTISGYSGTAGDSLANHNGMRFTTFDSDNDRSSGNCAEIRHGAWWYNGCHHSNLNGEYKRTSSSPNYRGIIWYHWMGYTYSLPHVEMKIKEM